MKAEANSLFDGDDQTKHQLDLSFLNISRTTKSQCILNRSDCTFLSWALARRLVRRGAKPQTREQMSQVASTGVGGDHDVSYAFALPWSLPHVLAWARLLARVQRGELQP